MSFPTDKTKVKSISASTLPFQVLTHLDKENTTPLVNVSLQE